MVQALVRPTGEIAQAERPFGRSFYSESRLYFACNADLIPERYGIVGQVAEGATVDTVLFDARDPDEKFVWQHTRAHGVNGSGGRMLTELSVSKDNEVQGWQAEFDYSGRLVRTHALEEWEAAWQSIANVLRHPQTQARASEILAAFARHDLSLTRFMLNPEIRFTQRVHPEHFHGNLETATVDEKTGLVEVEVVKKMQGAELGAEIEKREQARQKIGYMAVAPQLRPAVPKPVPYLYQPKLSSKVFSE